MALVNGGYLHYKGHKETLQNSSLKPPKKYGCGPLKKFR